MPNYGDINYWETRYLEQKTCTFDWLEDYESLRPLFEEIFKPDSPGSKRNFSSQMLSQFSLSQNNLPSPNQSVLMLGCGNSELSEKLYKEMSVKSLVNIDASHTVIKNMKDRVPELTWEVMDCKDLKYSNSFFDIVIDKATMDSLLCGDSPFLNVALMTKEVQRVLKTGGVYLLISHSEPDSRMEHLIREHLSFDITVQSVRKSFLSSNPGENIVEKEKVHYVYICKKKVNADNICLENFAGVYKELERGDLLEEDEEIGDGGDFEMKFASQNN